MGNPHVVVIPWPAQGHVIPLMTFSLILVQHGCRVTFLITESTRNRIMDAQTETETHIAGDQLRLVSIPGLDLHEDKKRPGNLTNEIMRSMPHKVEEFLMEELNDGITCVVADQCLGWALEIAAKLGIPRAAFFPASALVLALVYTVPKLIDDGIIDSDGESTL